jgi:L-histidine N-alpha-methyltransferase
MNVDVPLRPWSESPVTVDVRLDPRAARRALLEEARSGLTAAPRELSPKWLYDERGSELFEEITRLPEYYPTRREREILSTRARAIARVSRADTLVELGSGASVKTRLLLSALAESGGLRRFVPFDVSEAMLRQSAEAIAREFPGLQVHGVVGDFERHLGAIPDGGRRLLLFLGGTIGNLKPAGRAAFLAQVSAAMGPDDRFLLGTDLLKDVGRLERAYDDARGVTAAFNLNVLRVLNRELDARFEPGRFRHRARFDAEQSWIEMLLVPDARHSVEVRGLGLSLEFDPREPMRTEVSTKFRPAQVGQELAAAGLELLEWWTDAQGDFAVSLSRRV